MSDQEVVCRDPGLGLGFVAPDLMSVSPLLEGQKEEKRRHRDIRRKDTMSISMCADTPRFVECQPMLDAITISLKTESSVVGVVGDEFLPVHKSSIAVVQAFR